MVGLCVLGLILVACTVVTGFMLHRSTWWYSFDWKRIAEQNQLHRSYRLQVEKEDLERKERSMTRFKAEQEKTPTV